MEKLELVRPKPVPVPGPDNRQNRRAAGRASLKSGVVNLAEQRAAHADDPAGGTNRTEFDRASSERQRVHDDQGDAPRSPHTA
jgi:hypothetical protein